VIQLNPKNNLLQKVFRQKYCNFPDEDNMYSHVIQIATAAEAKKHIHKIMV